MALETLKGITNINGQKIVVMDELREQFPEKFTETGAMDHKWFESEIRPTSFIYVRHDKNSLAFTLQDGPVKEKGVNGCQVVDVIAVARQILLGLNEKFPCEENRIAARRLEQAVEWLNRRTLNREQRGVEGTAAV